MTRVQIRLPQVIIDNLDKTSDEKGVSCSEIIRRIIDQYYDRKW